MNYQKIKVSAIILGCAYFFMFLGIFSNLSKFEELAHLSRLVYFIIPGFVAFGIGTALIRKESKFFKATFIASMSLDGVFIFYILLALISALVPSAASVIGIIIKIIEALLTVGLAVCNHLLAGGIKDLFVKKRDTKMATYSMIMSFCVNKLALFSTVIPLVKISKISASLIVGATLLVDIVFQGSFCVFMFVTAYQLSKSNNQKQEVKVNNL